jgi:hypothetical protein
MTGTRENSNKPLQQMELDHFLDQLHKIRQLLMTRDGMTQTTQILRDKTKITKAGWATDVSTQRTLTPS